MHGLQGTEQAIFNRDLDSHAPDFMSLSATNADGCVLLSPSEDIRVRISAEPVIHQGCISQPKQRRKNFF